MNIGEYIKEAASKPWQWGVHDCCTFAGDWMQIKTGVDPVAHWRGRYDDEQGAIDFIVKAGGIEVLWAQGLEGLAECTDDPVMGDVGIIETLGGHIGAIYMGKRWAFLSERGVHHIHIDDYQIVKAWNG